MVDAYLGKWSGEASTKYFSGDVLVNIQNVNGEYAVEVQLPGRFARAKPQFSNITETENGLKGDGLLKLLKSFNIVASISFDGDKMEAAIEVPQVKLAFNIKNGHRV